MESCDCDWPSSETGGVEPCGGCEQNCRLYRDAVVHHDGKHWHVSCLAQVSLSKLDQAEKDAASAMAQADRMQKCAQELQANWDECYKDLTDETIRANEAEKAEEQYRRLLDEERLLFTVQASRLDRIVALVNEQAEDEGLWSVPIPPQLQPISEAYLQQELRRLHAAVESVVENLGKKSNE